MNYYEHHLGDYDGATAHLSWQEDCAYRRMLCLYYRTESALPADSKQLCRLLRAKTKTERAAVQQVLVEFFELADDGWHNARCDEDIATFRETEPDREAKREHAKERQRRTRERRRALFEALRRHDVVPAWDTPTRTLEAQLKEAESRVTGLDVAPDVAPAAAPVTPPVTAPVTRDDTATQSPPPTSHLPPPSHQTIGNAPPGAGAKAPRRRRAEAAASPPADVAEQVWHDWLALRRAKRAPVTATVLAGARAEAVKAEMTLEAFLRVWCARGSQGLEASWLKPNERSPPPGTEPAWRREQRQHNEGFLGPAAARRAPPTIDLEPTDADPQFLG